MRKFSQLGTKSSACIIAHCCLRTFHSACSYTSSCSRPQTTEQRTACCPSRRGTERRIRQIIFDVPQGPMITNYIYAMWGNRFVAEASQGPGCRGNGFTTDPRVCWAFEPSSSCFVCCIQQVFNRARAAQASDLPRVLCRSVAQHQVIVSHGATDAAKEAAGVCYHFFCQDVCVQQRGDMGSPRCRDEARGYEGPCGESRWI